jgi:acetyltransferase-like isoleucine patch superfamily enzyme
VTVVATSPGRYEDGVLPPGVRLGPDTVVTGAQSFQRFRARHDDALVVGAHCTIDRAHFAVGERGRVRVGDHCYFTSPVLLCDLAVTIGSYVVLAWNVTITDTDFHPLEPAARVADALACSPLGAGRPRPSVACAPVVIEDAVWIGPNATILKGVRLGAGAFVEPGAVVTRDVAPYTRVIGNPARPVGEAGP